MSTQEDSSCNFKHVPQARIQGGGGRRGGGGRAPLFWPKFRFFNVNLVHPEGAKKIWTMGRPPF